LRYFVVEELRSHDRAHFGGKQLGIAQESNYEALNEGCCSLLPLVLCWPACCELDRLCLAVERAEFFPVHTSLLLPL
jgi:hypothetical protein